MATTCQELLYKLGKRRHDLVTITAESSGDTTHLVASEFLQFAPGDIQNFNRWLRGSTSADIANRGVERLATDWDATATRLSLSYPMPGNMTEGVYELRSRTRYELYLEALNAAVTQLALYWWRPIRSELITSVSNQWRYPLSDDIPWFAFGALHVQMVVNANLVGYPYMDASRWNPRFEREVDDSGDEHWFIQFGVMPPPGRILRIYAQTAYDELANDDDMLLIDGEWGRLAVEWLMSYTSACLDDWAVDEQIKGDIQRVAATADRRLAKQQDLLLRTAPGRPNLLITVPGMRDGMRPTTPRDLRYLAGFHTPGP